MKKIKVLHITQATIGGTLEYIKLFFKYIDKEKFDVELICPSYGPMKEEIHKLGVKVHVVDMKRNINIFNDFKTYIKLRKYIKELNPDIVHLHSSKAGVLGRFAAYSYKVPCIYNPHGWAFGMNVNEKKKKIYAIIERVCSKVTKKVVNISDNEEELAIRYKVAQKNKMITIYNGIDVDNYNCNFNRIDILNKLSIPNDAFIIGMVGRLTEQKSPETFLKIAKMLLPKIKNAYFILVGDGELREKLEKIIDKNQLNGRVIITGWTNEVNKYISIFDIGILTSKWEGFGLVLAEYMASGKPIVASDVGGIPNVIKNYRNGILVKYNDVDGFVNSILKIKEDSKLRNEFINNSYIDVKSKFDIKRVVKQHEKLYLRVINKS